MFRSSRTGREFGFLPKDSDDWYDNFGPSQKALTIVGVLLLIPIGFVVLIAGFIFGFLMAVPTCIYVGLRIAFERDWDPGRNEEIVLNACGLWVPQFIMEYGEDLNDQKNSKRSNLKG